MQTQSNTPMLPPSKRSHVYYIEKAILTLAGTTLAYRSNGDPSGRSINVPVSNTSMLILGEDVQLSQTCLRKLSDHGVMLCLCQSSGTDKHAFQIIEPQVDIVNDHLQHQWLRLVIDEDRALKAARCLLSRRLAFIAQHWETLPAAQDYGLFFEDIQPHLVSDIKSANRNNATLNDVRNASRRITSKIMTFVAPTYGFHPFRQHGGDNDLSHDFISIARLYGLGHAAVALHGFGIPYSLAVLEKKSGRCGLVSDFASIVFEGLLLPIALESAMLGLDKETLCANIRSASHQMRLTDFLLQSIREVCETC